MIVPELTEKYIDFIGMYENVFPQHFCHHIICEFDKLFEKGLCGTRKKHENIDKYLKNDSYYSLSINNHDNFGQFDDHASRHILQMGLQRCFDAYTEKFDILKENDLQSTYIKFQKTDPGEGYHVWHCEQNSGGGQANRCLVWAIYLNDIDDAGETEFLYQKLRVPPKENTCLIWPAAYTHTHRGNVVHGKKSKYIVTGWFYLE